MIVEKGQQQQLAIQRQHQQQQQQQQQQRHLATQANNLIATSSGCDETEEEEDGDNDEENIVIDMADEDDEDETQQDVYDDEQRQYQHDGAGVAHHFNHQQNNGNSLPVGAYANNNNNNNYHIDDGESNKNCHIEEGQLSNHANELRTFQAGELIWFDPNQYGYSIPGKVIDYYTDLNVLTVEGYTQVAPESIHDGQYELTSELEFERRNKLLLDAEGELQVYELSDLQQLSTVRQRQPLTDLSGREDLVDLEELSLDSIIWNLKLRYKQEIVYTRCGHKILISVNPFKQLCNLYNLDQVNKYDTVNPNKLTSLTLNQSSEQSFLDLSSSTNLIRWLLLHDSVDPQRCVKNNGDKQNSEPHVFGIANEALKRLLITGQDQCFVLLGESGSGKTETCKLLVQYLATVNKSPTNLMTEQILEAIQVLESFGNAKTVYNDNSSRFGKLLDIRINLANGFILDAKTVDLNLLDRSRIVSQTENERNYHVFYEMLSGLSGPEKEKYGLQTAEKYFYLNQGHCVDLAHKEEGDDFRSLLASMQVLGFNYEEQDTIFRLLASVLHLGNIYFHRKVLAVRSGKLAQQQQKLFNDNSQTAGVEGVEIGSDTEVRWVSHLLQIQFDSVMRCLTVRTTETSGAGSNMSSGANATLNSVDRIVSPLNIDQALDTRDAIARALYTCLFKWLVKRINIMINGDASDADEANSLSQRQQQQQEPVYLCRTSDSLCEFQPDKLAAGNSAASNTGTGESRRRDKQRRAGKSQQRRRQAAASVSILDAFGFENLAENNFEQLCVNYAAELLHYHTNRYLIRLEQAEYARERLRWTPLSQLLVGGAPERLLTATCAGSAGATSGAIVNLISKKPLGILALLDDECNFPKATDQSFAEKCHHNHTLNDNYQRARLAAQCQEFGVRHFRQANRLVWYQVEGFVEKNRDVLRADIVELLLDSKMVIVADMLRKLHQAQDFAASSKTLSRTFDGRYVSMKPRATTVAARFQDALHNNRVLESINCAAGEQAQYLSAPSNTFDTSDSHQQQHQQQRPNPWFVVCVRPNRSRTAGVFDVAYVQDQVRSFGVHELAAMRKHGFPVRLRYGEFVRRYKCLAPQKFLDKLAACQPVDIKAASSSRRANTTAEATGEPLQVKRAIREVCSALVEFRFSAANVTDSDAVRAQYQCGLTKMFLNEKLFHRLELMRLAEHQKAVALLQRTLRMWLARREFLTKRRAAIKIQALIRANLARADFWRQYMLIVNLQRRWRQQLVIRRRRALEARRRLQRQQQLHQLQEMQAMQRKQANQFRHRHLPANKQPQAQIHPQSHYAAVRAGLDIPDELAQLYRLQRQWAPVHELAHLSEVKLGELAELEQRRLSRCKLNKTPFVDVPFVARDKAEDFELVGLKYDETSLVSDRENDIRKLIHKLEMDDKYALHKFPQKYYTIESPQFGYSRLPITRPFSWLQMRRRRAKALRQILREPLAKTDKMTSNRLEGEIKRRFDAAELKALAIYKLVLRYIDSDLSETSRQQSGALMDQSGDLQRLIKFKLLADYVIYLCISEPLLRDEIYLQLASQSWQNPKEKSAENAWKLTANCLSCFGPLDSELAKFMVKFSGDYCCDKYKHLIMERLAAFVLVGNKSNKSAKLAYSCISQRRYPPSMLEYWANQNAENQLALAASCYMGDQALNGHPAEPVGDSSELASVNHTNRTLVQVNSFARAEQLAAALLRVRNVPAGNLAGWSVEVQHEGAQSELSSLLRGDERLFDHLSRVELLPDFVRLIETGELEHLPAQQSMSELQYPAQSSIRRSAMVSPSGSKRHSAALSQRSSDLGAPISRVRVASEADLSSGLVSRTSKLNRRYLNEIGPNRPVSPPVDQCDYQPQRAACNPYGYLDYSDHQTMLHRRSMSMQELQLAASSALNGRYFHQQHQQYPLQRRCQAQSSNHYAASYVSGPPGGSLQQLNGLATQGRPTARRSRTPTSTSTSGQQRISSSAYGSESRNSSAYLAAGSLDQEALYGGERRGRMPGRPPPAHSGSLSRDGRRAAGSRPRRSASSSSRAPRQFASNGNGSDYASAAYSDYERVGGPRYAAGYKSAQRRPSGHKQQVGAARARQDSSGQQAYGYEYGYGYAGAEPVANCKKPAAGQPAQQAVAHYMASSALSDTSEAPSLASHVRGVKVPQHNGDLDQYLDDLFNPMLDDADLDELSDARSLATSIKGADLSALCDATCLSRLIRGSDTEESGDKTARPVLSPTFESLLESLNNPTDCTLAADNALEPQATMAPLVSQLGGMNLSELKALNEQLEHEIQAAQLSNRLSVQESISIPAPPPQPSFGDDVYDRAKTVRIGKWRWPPARDSVAQSHEHSLPAAVDPAEQIASYYESRERKAQRLSQQSASSQEDAAKEPSQPSGAADSTSGESLPASSAAPPSGDKKLGSTAGVGKLKISTEMKAKLELLTTGSGGRESATPSQPQQSQQQATGVVSAARLSLLSAALGSGSGSADEQSQSQTQAQRRHLLEQQLSGAQSTSGPQEDPLELAGSSASGKVMAAKQQLAAAAGVALAALDGFASGGSSQAPSRRQSGLLGKSGDLSVSQAEAEVEVDRGGDNEPAPARHLRVLQDELGPQSKSAISQRQAFYQMSASSDQLDQLDQLAAGGPGSIAVGQTKQVNCASSEHAGSEVHLAKQRSPAEPIPPPNAVSSDNLKQASALEANQPLTRAMQMAAHLNEAGQSSALGKESDRIYGRSIAKSLSQRQHESLLRAQEKGPRPHLQQQHQQWVSSLSPERDRGASSPGSLSGEPNSSRKDRVNTKRSSTEPEQAAKRRGAGEHLLVSGNSANKHLAQHKRGRSAGQTRIRAQNSLETRGEPVSKTVKLKRQQGSREQVCLVYANVDWQVKVRKEFFLPSESYDDQLVVQLIFAQLVADVFNPRHFTRFNNKERAAIKALMKDNSIGYAPSLPQMGQMQSVKRDLIRMARSFGLYFTRSYKALNFALTFDQPILDPIEQETFYRAKVGSAASSPANSSADEHEEAGQVPPAPRELALKLLNRLRNANNLGVDWIDMVAVHHSGLRLVSVVGQAEQRAPATRRLNPAEASCQQQQLSANSSSFGYKVLETLKYRDMTDVSLVGQRELLVSMRNGKKCWLISSPEVAQLGSLLKCFHADYNDHLSQSTNSTSAGNSNSNSNIKTTPTTTNNNSLQKREKRANKDALLVADDDHHGDHIKQRQTSDRINRLHPATNTNDDLADGERVLPNNLAFSSNSPQRINDITSNSSISSKHYNEQYQSPLSPAAADGSRLAPAQRRTTSGSLESPDQTGELPINQQAASSSSKRSEKQESSEKQENSNSKKKNLWQNSLSRMSNKFSIFGGSQSRSKQTSVDLSPNNNNNNNNGHNNDNNNSKAARGKQSNETPIVQVALDAWIETKVDFDEDEDNATDGASQSPFDAQVVSGHTNQKSADSSYPSKSSVSDADQQQDVDSAGRHSIGDESLAQSGAQKRSFASTATEVSASDQQPAGQKQQQTSRPNEADGKHSLLQFALYNFREAIDKYSLESRANKAAQTGGSGSGDTSTLRGSLKLIETLRSARGGAGASGSQGGSQLERSAAKERKASRLLSSQAADGKQQQANGDWTWRELAEMVKFTQVPIKQSLLKLPSEDLNKRALDCFMAIMQYMGDVALPTSGNNNNSKHHYQANEVECVYLILMNCHNYPILKDEIYCQLMKQTTNNRSSQADSCLRGWRLFSIVAAYFDCSEPFKPYLLKYLETAAYDKRRAYCSVAALCLQNLRKTFKYNGRKNVPSIEEIAATSAGRNSKRQIYRLPGGTERVINTKSTTVVEDIIFEICSNMLNVTDPDEMLEFSLYCIADGDLYTMPLNRDEYILDITTELIKNHQQYFLIFCRSIWHYPLRLDSKLYIEVIFNQIAPDYLEGLLLVLPALGGGRKGAIIDHKHPLRLKTKLVKEIARIAALLHRASGTDYMPHKDEVKYLLPKPIISAMKQHQRALIAADHLSAGSSAGSASSSSSSSATTARNGAFGVNNEANNDLLAASSGQSNIAAASSASGYPLDTVITTPQKWIELVQNNWRDMSAFDTLDAKAQFLDIVRHWPLFGSSFFAIKFIQRDLIQPMDFILALNKLGIQMLDMATHETIHKYPFNEVISTRKVRSEDGALFLDLKCGNLMKRTIIRIQTDQAHEISRLIRQYIDIELLQQKQRQQQQQQQQQYQLQTNNNQQAQITDDYIDYESSDLNQILNRTSEQESS